jgi:hypothetical protein
MSFPQCAYTLSNRSARHVFIKGRNKFCLCADCKSLIVSPAKSLLECVVDFSTDKTHKCLQKTKTTHSPISCNVKDREKKDPSGDMFVVDGNIQ